MRQTGYMAGCAAYALTHNFPLLPRVHALAKRMQQGLEELGVGILSPAETCMVGDILTSWTIRPEYDFNFSSCSMTLHSSGLNIGK
jgi:threonine aldolase